MLPYAYVTLKAISLHRWLSLAALWFGAQAVWLKFAYDLEFVGKPAFLPLWSASLLFMAANTFIANQFIKYLQ